MGRLFFPIFILLFACFFFLRPVPTFAQEEFATGVVAEYSVLENGETRVSHTITLTNLFSNIHAVSYSFILEGVKPQNISASENKENLPHQASESGELTKITIQFPKAVVGKGKSRTFTISYHDVKTAVKNGQVWEITIPRVQEITKYQNFTLNLLVPRGFGKPAFLSPKPDGQEEAEGKTKYIYLGEKLAQTGIVAAFGEFQVFNFSLAYHLRNPHTRSGETEIALPPDTAFQRVYYKSINPKPKSIRLDDDGNWLAKYIVSAGEQIDVDAEGSVQVFAQPQTFYPKPVIDEEKYLAGSQFWQTNEPQIKNLARQLGTPKDIYDFIVKNLSYDYNRVKQGIERLGALLALNNPKNAICMEFTDLFVALARSAGIPAREVNGFAYTDNPELQPLSLVADVLHAWPEFWDRERKIWVPVDPTWGNTTGGVDYFSKFDLSHITFVNHGIDPTEPLPAGSYKLAENPQKDVVVYFGNLPEKRTSTLVVNPIVERNYLPWTAFRGRLVLKNDGPVAMYNIVPKITKKDGDLRLLTPKVDFLAPFSEAIIPFTWKANSLNDSPSFTILANSGEISYTLSKEFVAWQLAGIFILLVSAAAVLLSPLLLRKKISIPTLPKKFKAGDVYGEPEKNDNPKKTSGKTWRLPFQRRGR